MKYINLINHFWKMHHIQEFSPKEAFLYFALLNECNLRGWKNPFECTNKSLVATTGMSEKYIIETRNKLQERGLIDIAPGERHRQPPIYTIRDFQYESQNESQSESQNGNINIKNKNKTKTETKERERSLPPPPGKNEMPTLGECRQALMADAGYLLRLNSRYGWKDTHEARGRLDRFFDRLEAEAVERKDTADAKSHFVRWLDLQMKTKPVKQQTYGNTKRTKNYADS